MRFIERFIKKEKNIIHGRKALNAQMPQQYQRVTRDWDLFGKNPQKEAQELQEYLDKKVGYDRFYVSVISLGNTKINVIRVLDRKGGEVADFMKTPKIKKLYTTIEGMRYETLQRAKKVYKKILANPKFAYRWPQTRYDLNTIEQYENDLKLGRIK